MKKSISVAIGVIIAICIAIGVVLYVYKPFKLAPKTRIGTNVTLLESMKTTSKEKTSMYKKFENLLFASVNMSSSTHYSKYRYAYTHLRIYISKTNTFTPGSYKFIMNVNEYINDAQSGYVRNGTTLKVYIHVRNITLTLNVVSYKSKTSREEYGGTIEVLNVSYLFLYDMKKNLMRYCIDGRVIIRSGNYRNTTVLRGCYILNIPFSLQTFMLAPSFAMNITKILVKDIIPIFIRNLTLISEKTIGGVRCYMYELSEKVNLSKILLNRTLIENIATKIAKSLKINTTKEEIEGFEKTLARAATVLSLFGLDKWNINAEFCITPTGRLVYLVGNVSNIDKRTSDVRISVYEKVVGYIVMKNYVNTSLLRSIEFSMKNLPNLSSAPALEYVMSSQVTLAEDPTLVLLSGIEAQYMLYTATLQAKAVRAKAPATTGVAISITSFNPKEISLMIENIGTVGVKYIDIFIIRGYRIIQRYSIGCEKPLSGSITITCTGQGQCKISISGKGKCTRLLGKLQPSKLVRGETYRITVHVVYENGKAETYSLGPFHTFT